MPSHARTWPCAGSTPTKARANKIFRIGTTLEREACPGRFAAVFSALSGDFAFRPIVLALRSFKKEHGAGIFQLLD